MPASAIGHGQLGLRSNLRTFEELAADSASAKHALAEIRLGSQIPLQSSVVGGGFATNWRLHSGSTYKATIAAYFDFIWRDIVAVEVNTTQPVTGTRFLKRMETLADCVATAGTYYFAPPLPSAGAPALWGDHTATWGDGQHTWGQSYPQLYVHRTETGFPPFVEAIFAFYFAFASQSHAQLSDDMLTDGDLETWTSSTNLTSWTEVLSGTGAVTQESVIVRSGMAQSVYSAKLSSGSVSAEIRQTVTLQAGAVYRFCGYYLTDITQAVQRAVIFIVSPASDVVLVDGRNWPSGGLGVPITATNGQWRRFAFDFMVKTTGAHTVGIYADNASGASVTYVDGLKLQRVWRYNHYEPRLTGEVPSSESSMTNMFFGGKSVGSGELSLLNGDTRVDGASRLDVLFGNFDAVSREVRMFHGGEFLDGQELLIDDFRRGFTGRIQDVEWSDESVVLQLEDSRKAFSAVLPTRAYGYDSFLTLADRDKDRVRPLLFGTKYGIKPARVVDTGLGEYEVCDTTDAVNGVMPANFGPTHPNPTVYSYVSDDAAARRDSTQRVTLARNPNYQDYTHNANTARIVVIANPLPIIITQDNNKIDFNIGAGALVATIPPGTYSLGKKASFVSPASDYGLARVIGEQMGTASGLTYKCEMSTVAPYVVTITQNGGTLNLLCNTGANKDKSLWTVLGFDNATDKTGALAYTGTTEIFQADKVVLRVDMDGYRDDAAGTYTGTTISVIDKAPDIARFILIQLLGVPADLIDVPSFVAARAYCPQSLAIYVGSQQSAQDILDAIEVTAQADIVIDGYGKIYFRPYALQSTIVALSDDDFLDFKMLLANDHLFPFVSVAYDEEPALQTWKKEILPAASVVRFDKTEPREVQTYFGEGVNGTIDAIDVANKLAVFHSAPARRATVRVRGKLITSKLADRAFITRSRGLGPTGALSLVPFRITAIKHDYSIMETVASLVTV